MLSPLFIMIAHIARLMSSSCLSTIILNVKFVRRPRLLEASSHDVVKSTIVFHVLKPVIASHVFPLQLIRGQ